MIAIHTSLSHKQENMENAGVKVDIFRDPHFQNTGFISPSLGSAFSAFTPIFYGGKRAARASALHLPRTESDGIKD